MTIRKIDRVMIAKLLNISYRTVCAKMKGRSSFNILEAFKIRDFVAPDFKIDYLFAEDKNSR